jgi:hypothetical protein
VAIVAAALAIASPGGKTGLLDPDAVDSGGSRALATLLRDRGIEVTRVTSVASAVAQADATSTLVVTLPVLLPPSQVEQLGTSASDLVLVAPDEATLSALAMPVSVTGFATVKERDPRCNLAAATRAGSVDIGGYLYSPQTSDAAACYPAGGAPSLLQFRDGERTVTALGSGTAFTNDRLGHVGNAALGLNILGAHPRIVWLVPSLSDAIADAGHKSLVDLLPNRVLLVVGQLAIAVFLVALWRARRLGAIVAEPLPVIVRAAEAVEGRARLYRAAGARDRAADALRTGCRSRLAPLLGLPPDAEPDAVTAAVAARSGRPETAVRDLLYGAAPDGDAALVRLADDLDTLAGEVRRT